MTRYTIPAIIKQLGRVVRRKRLALNLTQEQLAKLSGLHRTYISDVESGLRSLSLKTCARLAAALNCSCAALIRLAETTTE